MNAYKTILKTKCFENTWEESYQVLNVDIFGKIMDSLCVARTLDPVLNYFL